MNQRILLKLAAVLLFIVIIAGIWLLVTVRTSLPKINGEIEVAGLEKPVTVIRDTHGVPHIKAESQIDLYRALGFVNAQDRLWQIDTFRRMSQGRLAEIFGPKLIPLDYRHRTIGFQKLGRKLYSDAEENSKAICRAYVEGINDFIKSHTSRLPMEFMLLRYKPELWSPEDTYAVLTWQQWMVTFNWETELALVALVQKLGADKAFELINIRRTPGPSIIPESEKQYSFSVSRKDNLIIPPEFDYNQIRFLNPEPQEDDSDGSVAAMFKPAGDILASNCWVVSGERSQSGHPLLSNDPHIPHTLPSIWYMVHLSAPGIDDAAGITTLGVPMIVMGHTRHIAWGDTTTVADTQDLFIEKLNPDNPNEYFYRGGFKSFEVIKERIWYQEEGEMKFVDKEIRLTEHGPIINDIADPPVDPATPLAMRWAGYGRSDMVKAGDLLLKAKNWDEFRGALSHIGTPIWNWVYADAEGDIGYQLAGYVPVRKRGSGLFPVPGWLDEYDWDGVIPYDDMPRLSNPSNGYIVTANNKVTPEDYPYFISGSFAPPYRATRIEERMLSKKKLSVEDMRSIQLDVYSKQGELLRDLFVSACEKYPQPGADFRSAVENLREWDFDTGSESVGASVFYESYAVISRKVFGGSMGADIWKKIYRCIGGLEDLIFSESTGAWFDDPKTAAVETRDEAIALGVAEAATSLRGFFQSGPATWKWGNLRPLTFRHPLGRSGLLAKWLNIGPVDIGGSNATVNPANFFYDSKEKPYQVFAGPSMRTVVDFAEVEQTQMVITLGQSGHPSSSYYSDQLSLWLKGEAFTIWKTPDAIKSHSDGHLILKPKDKS